MKFSNSIFEFHINLIVLKLSSAEKIASN